MSPTWRRGWLPLALALAAAGAPAPAASATPGPARLYLHSAAGTYLGDWAADRSAAAEGRAPHGSTLSAKAPNDRVDATARNAGVQQVDGARPGAGEPGTPTFALPWSGSLSAVCLDLWVQSNVRQTVPQSGLSVYVGIQTPGGPGKAVWVRTQALTRAPYDGALVRLLGRVALPRTTRVPNGSALVVAPYVTSGNPDWVLAYDSAVHPSAVTLNPRDCAAPSLAYPRPGCVTVADPATDAAYAIGDAKHPEPSMDISGVTIGSAAGALVAFVRVPHLASRPAYAPGYAWYLSFLVNGDLVTASRTAYDPDALGVAEDTAAAAGDPARPRTVLDVNGTVRAAALNVTFDVARGMVVFVLPIRDLTAAVGGLTLGRVFTRVSARSADAYPGHVVAVDSTPNGAWRAGDNRCFGQR